MQAVAVARAPARPARRALRRASDERLLARIRRGDDAAFEALYDRHHRGLLAFCRHMLGTQEEAEDALQHVFLAAHRHLRGGSREVQLKPWLYAVARNRCLSVLRARRESVRYDEAVEPATHGSVVDGAVERRQDLRELLGDLAGLPDDQRAALVLAELGDLSHDEIGAALGVRGDKVKALVFQARRSLMSARRARETDCREIQEQLATLRGGALRHATLRRHVAACPACAAFRAEVRRQRAALALVLPVAPSAMLKQTLLAGLAGGGATAAAGGASAGGGLAGGGLAAGGLVAKVAVAAALLAGAGGTLAARQLERHPARGGSATPAAAARPIPAPGARTHPRPARAATGHASASATQHRAGMAAHERPGGTHGRRHERGGAGPAHGHARGGHPAHGGAGAAARRGRATRAHGAVPRAALRPSSPRRVTAAHARAGLAMPAAPGAAAPRGPSADAHGARVRLRAASPEARGLGRGH
jgi:RNA polymerase sigma factor (sigma-70 family)